MKTKVGILTLSLAVLLLAGIGYGAWFWYANLRGIGPAVQAPPQDIRELVNTTGLPLNAPDGFKIEIFADAVPGARVLRFDSAGNLWVSQRAAGIISRLTITNGQVAKMETMLSGLTNPHGLAFDPTDPDRLYFATETAVWRYRLGADENPQLVTQLAGGGGHSTRTLGFGPDGRLYVSIGSSCNVCVETNPQRAAIWVYDFTDQSFEPYATGLRNSVFFTWRNDALWATDHGRDLLGDDVPPDEVNIIEAGKFYGWPYCYGRNVHDRAFDDSATAAARCASATPSQIDIQAHSAVLGLAFIPDDQGWPQDWVGDLLVAYHGSWNRSVPTGYKIARHDLDGDTPISETDFVSGWLTDEGALGRPVDLLFQGSALYVSDDKAGVIYRIQPQ